MADFDWDCVARELHERGDQVLVSALARYVEERRPYVLKMRSPNALPWIDFGQYAMVIRIDDSESFWKLRDQIAGEHGVGRVR